MEMTFAKISRALASNGPAPGCSRRPPRQWPGSAQHRASELMFGFHDGHTPEYDMRDLTRTSLALRRVPLFFVLRARVRVRFAGRAPCSAALPTCSKVSCPCSFRASNAATPRRCSSWSRKTCASRSATSTRASPPTPGLSERLMGQVRKLEAEQKDLRAKTTAHLRAGNNAAAGQYALRLQTRRGAARGEPQAARAGRNHLQESRQGARRRRADRARQDRKPQGRHQRHAHEPGHGRDPRDVGRHDHQHRRRRRHAQSPRGHGRGRARQGRRPRARRQGLGRHDRRRTSRKPR